MAISNQIDPPEPDLHGEIDAAYEEVLALSADAEDICARLDDFGFISQETIDRFEELEGKMNDILGYLRAEIPEPDPDEGRNDPPEEPEDLEPWFDHVAESNS